MPLKVVHYVDGSAFGGTEQILLSLLARLDRDRWEPVLFHHPGHGIEPLIDGARELGVRTRELPRMQGVGALWTTFPSFVRAVRSERPEILHAHLGWLLSCKFGLTAARLARVPAVVATLQQFLPPPWKRNIYWQQRIMAASVHRYVAVSHAVAEQLVGSFRVPSDKVEVIHNAVPLERHETAANHDREGRQRGGEPVPTVLTIARLDRQKGLNVLLRAIPSIPDARFLVAGEGEERSALVEQARRLGISERIAFLGHRTNVSALLAACDVFVLPSLYEGFPLSVLEAMAAGTPVVATAVGGTPEAVVDRATGYLVPPGDADALADAVRKVLSDPGRGRDMGSAGRERVERLFTLEVMVERYSTMYERAMKKGRRSWISGDALPTDL